MLLLIGCSTRKNSAGSRFYHAMTTRYNVYHNGIEAFNAGIEAQEKGNKDNFIQTIPLYPIGNEATTAIGNSHFERAVEKAQKAIRLHSIKRRPTRNPGRAYTEEYKKWLNQKEFNPFLHHAWMLLGKAQYQKGEFEEAAVTFSYIARLYQNQPTISTEALIQQANCYAALEWNYEAEDLLNRVNNDTLPNSLINSYTSARCNQLLTAGRIPEAIPHLEHIVTQKQSKLQKARAYYLLGQLYQQTGQQNKAYEAYKKVIRQNPPYELSMSARIRQTEVMPANDIKSIGKKLLRMSKEEKNKPFISQIYYALGNVHLTKQDTLSAIDAYQKGIKESSDRDISKGILYLTLGNLYWQMGNFNGAHEAYNGAIGQLERKHKQYGIVLKRTEVLDLLVPHINTIHLQDSLQTLAAMSEEERLNVIQRIITRTMAQEEADRKAMKEAESATQQQETDAQTTIAMSTITPNIGNNQKQAWYFYNPQLVEQGKTEFIKQWGKRKAEDNWRRKNKTVFSLDDFEDYDYSQEETSSGNSTQNVEVTHNENNENHSHATSNKNTEDSANDKYHPDYYLKQIPLSDEAMKNSNELLAEALFNAGKIFKENLEEYTRAEACLDRVVQQFPDFKQRDAALYHLFLLKLAMNHSQGKGNGASHLKQAEVYKQELLIHHANSQYAQTLADPDFIGNAIYGKQREDSLYAATYLSYQQGMHKEVEKACEISAQKYPKGKHRAKFLFIQAVTQLQTDNQKGFLAGLKELVKNYSEQEITEIAAYILKGIQEGRLLNKESNAFGNIWEKRQYASSEEIVLNDTIANMPLPQDAFSTERAEQYRFILAYEAGSVNENLLLYEVARYNFSTFLVKNFDLSFVNERGVGMLQITSFTNYDEAYLYFHRLYANEYMAERLSGLRAIIISESNYKQLMEKYSFEDYNTFFKEHFMTIPERHLKGHTLDEPLQNLMEEEKDEHKPEENDNKEELEEENGVIFEE